MSKQTQCVHGVEVDAPCLDCCVSAAGGRSVHELSTLRAKAEAFDALEHLIPECNWRIVIMRTKAGKIVVEFEDSTSVDAVVGDTLLSAVQRAMKGGGK